MGGGGVGYRSTPDTEEKWRLHVTKILWWMIALVASGVPPILRWYFDGLIDVDTVTSLPEVRSRPYRPTSVWHRDDWQQPNQPPSLMDDTAVVHRRQCKQLGRRRSRSRGFVSFEIDLTLRSTIVAESRNGITVLIKLLAIRKDRSRCPD